MKFKKLITLFAVLMFLATSTASAQTQSSTTTVGGTDYTLFTGFTATDGNGTNYAKLVDGNTSTEWGAQKSYNNGDPNAPAGDFNGGTDDPAFVEFHADEPIVPKGYVLTCNNENAGFWKPVEWALKARLNESDGWTTIHSSNTTLGQGKTFEIACTNDGNNEYQYFRFEVYEVGTTRTVDLDELQFYGLLPAYTHLTVKAATCMATGIKQDCYRRNSDGKYFTDNTGTTELAESDVIAPIIPHTGEHHEATDVNIEYWQCSMCGKYFSDEGYTTEITEEQTKIYRTITIDNSISSLVKCYVSRVLAGETVYLYISDLIDASTLKVNNGAVELTAETDIQYAFTMPATDVTVTAEVAQSNADGDILTGSIRHTVTIPDGASITLNNATISGSIVCEGSATITLVGTNSVSGATFKAGIQIGGSGTTLTIKGNGSLTAKGGSQSAGIGLSRIWNYDSNVTSGDIVIEGGTITATGGNWGSGIGIGTVKNTNNDNSTSVQFGNVTIKGGTVTATGGDSGDGIGKGYSYPGPAITFGTVTIYDGIDKVDASSIKDFDNVVYMHGESKVTTSKSDYFAVIENGNRRLIVQKPVIADIDDQTYTGSEIKPEPQVKIGSLSLVKGTDYEYSYSDNTNVGTAKVTVTFKGDYASLGCVEKEFNIIEDLYVFDIPAQTYTGSAIEPEVVAIYGETKLALGTDYTVSYSDNTNVGTAKATITGKGNYSGTVEKTFTIVPKVTELGALTLTEDQNGITAEINGNYDQTDAFSLDNDIENVSVTINRTFTSGMTSTIVLPFDIEVDGYSGGEFYEFSDIDTKTWTATMSKVTSVTAHTPYLFIPNDNALTISKKVTLKATSGTAATTKNGWTFTGVYQKKVWGADDGDNKDYCFAANATDGISVGDFVKIGTYVQVKPFRCYLTNSTLSKSKTNMPEKITIRLIDETSSVIDPLTPDPLNPNPSDLDITTPVSEITPNSGVKVWSYDGTIYIESQPDTDYTIIDLTGRTLTNGVTTSTRETVTLSRRAAGIVIVKIGQQTFKVNY